MSCLPPDSPLWPMESFVQVSQLHSLCAWCPEPASLLGRFFPHRSSLFPLSSHLPSPVAFRYSIYHLTYGPIYLTLFFLRHKACYISGVQPPRPSTESAYWASAGWVEVRSSLVLLVFSLMAGSGKGHGSRTRTLELQLILLICLWLTQHVLLPVLNTSNSDKWINLKAHYICEKF